MSRSGMYVDDGDDPLGFGRFRGRVKSAIRGQRGQAFLRETLAALDAMPVKELIAEYLRDEEGQVCTLGAVMVAKGLKVIDYLDPSDHEAIGELLNIAPCLVQEVEFENDSQWRSATPEERWKYMRKWVASKIKPEAAKA